MLSSSIPSKFNIPFANNAAPGTYIRAIPQASQVGVTPGAASLYDGFPPLTFVPISSGGVAPSGQDFNGILNAITKWVQWLNARAPVFYDAAFSAAIGGYPKGAMIAAAASSTWWLSSVENNTSNPDTGGAGWVQVVPSSPATVAPLINGTAAVGTSLAFARQDHVHPTDSSRAALSYVNSTFLTIATAAATYLTINNPTSTGLKTHTGNFTLNGDINASRPASPATGVIYLGNSGARYLFFDGTQYIMPGAELYVNGVPQNASIAAAQSTANTGVANAAAAQSTANTGVTNAATAQSTANSALSQAFGSGQSWQNLTSVRAPGTTYTNSTSRPIEVRVSCIAAINAYGILAPTVNGVALPTTSSLSGGAGGIPCATSFAVPPGQTYSVAVTAGSYSSWAELR